eukprot:g29141.t1
MLRVPEHSHWAGKAQQVKQHPRSRNVNDSGRNPSSGLRSGEGSPEINRGRRVRLGEGPNQSPFSDALVRLAELVFNLNYFSSDSSHFLQTWLAMGTGMGPSYARLIVGFVVQSLFHNYTSTIPHLFLRYIDDCISVAPCSHEDLEQFINFSNAFHPAIKFTWTISDTSLPFLDLS